MSLDDPNPLAESGVTMHSDSEHYSAGEDSSPRSSGSPAIVLYQPPTVWSLLRGTAINLLLPFINGMMLGWGELFAHEAAFRLGWGNTRVSTMQICIAGLIEGDRLLTRLCDNRSSRSQGGVRIPLALESRYGRSTRRRGPALRTLQAWNKH